MPMNAPSLARTMSSRLRVLSTHFSSPAPLFRSLARVCTLPFLDVERHKPAHPGKPAALSSDSEILWRALMSEFEDASQEVLAKLHTHETQGTQEALDDLVRAQHRRSNALADMLMFLDDLDEPSK